MDTDDVPVLYEIFYTKNQGFLHIEKILSDYPDEKEIILQDGLTFTVLSMQDIHIADADNNFRNCCHVQLYYPAIKMTSGADE